MPDITLTTIHITPFLAPSKEENTLAPRDAEWLREVVNMLYNRKKAAFHAAGALADTFHNHDERSQQTIVRYPLVQYHARADDFRVVGINEGGEALALLAQLYTQAVRVQDGLYVEIKPLETRSHTVSAAGSAMHRYRLADYLPFSAETYKTYRQLQYLKEKTDSIAERIEKHIVHDFAKHLLLGIDTLRVEVVDVESFQRPTLGIRVNKRRHDFKPFDVVFDADVDLPAGICLGNGKTYGYGLLQRLE